MPLRSATAMRTLSIYPHVLAYPLGSSLTVWGNTVVLCSVQAEERLPPFLQGKNQGWLRAEYDMLPGSTQSRRGRDAVKGKINGRSQEISRLIGRSLRSVVHLPSISDISLVVDCDVLQADGGTRTAAINGGYVALYWALHSLARTRAISLQQALHRQVAAISIGMVDGITHVDLDYGLDSQAAVDMNIVMDNSGNLIELQGCAEKDNFSAQAVGQFIQLATGAIHTIFAIQQRACAADAPSFSFTPAH